MSKVLSIVKLYVDGNQLEIADNGDFNPGGMERKSAHTANGRVRYTEAHKTATVKVDIFMDETTALADIQNWVGKTLMLECDTGQKFSIANAFVTKTFQVKGQADGKISLEFEGDKAEPM